MKSIWCTFLNVSFYSTNVIQMFIITVLITKLYCSLAVHPLKFKRCPTLVKPWIYFLMGDYWQILKIFYVLNYEKPLHGKSPSLNPNRVSHLISLWKVIKSKWTIGFEEGTQTLLYRKLSNINISPLYRNNWGLIPCASPVGVLHNDVVCVSLQACTWAPCLCGWWARRQGSAQHSGRSSSSTSSWLSPTASASLTSEWVQRHFVNYGMMR